MKTTKPMTLIAMISAILLLKLQFVSLSIAAGVLTMGFRMPFRYGTSLLTLFESLMMFGIYLVLAVLCVLLFLIEKYRADDKVMKKRCHKWLMLPLVFSILRILEKGVYLHLYEGRFSLRYYWMDLLIFSVLLINYLLVVYKESGFAWPLVAIGSLFILYEISRLVLPDLSPAYVVGVNIYISTFATAVLFYISYIFIAISIAGTQGDGSPVSGTQGDGSPVSYEKENP